MSPLLTVPISVVVRAAAFLAGAWAWDRAWTWFFYDRTGQEPIGADIGEGLVAFAVAVLLAAAWAVWDAWRRPFGVVAATWVGVGAVVAVSASLRTSLEAGELLVSDLLLLSPFLFCLLAVPAVLAGAVTAGVRSSR